MGPPYPAEGAFELISLDFRRAPEDGGNGAGRARWRPLDLSSQVAMASSGAFARPSRTPVRAEALGGIKSISSRLVNA
jgi:hypothetical protein